MSVKPKDRNVPRAGEQLKPGAKKHQGCSLFFLSLCFHSLSSLVSFFILASDQLSSSGEKHGGQQLPNLTVYLIALVTRGKKTKHKNQKPILTFFLIPSWKISGKDSLKQLESGKLQRVMKQYGRSCRNHKDGDKEGNLLEERGWGEVLGKQNKKCLWHLPLFIMLTPLSYQFHSLNKHIFTHLLSVCYMLYTVLDFRDEKITMMPLRVLGIQKYKET